MDNLRKMAGDTMKILLFAFILHKTVHSSWNDARSSYLDIYNLYYNSGTSLTDIIPVENQSHPIRVKMSLSLNSLNNFDAVKGQIEISGNMELSWVDEKINQIDFSSYAVDSVLIDQDKAWSPSIVLVNAVDTVKNIGDNTYKLKYDIATQTVHWHPRVLLRCSCKPDVTFYPFDRQVCDFTYTAWGYKTTEVRLQLTRGDWDTR